VFNLTAELRPIPTVARHISREPILLLIPQQ
jgi:hypothetical protein